MDSDCKALFLTVTPIELLVASDDDGVQALEQNCPGEQGRTTCRVYYKPKRNSSGKKWRQQILRVECCAHGQATVRIGIAKDQVLCCRTRARNVVGRKTCCYGKQQPDKINSTTNRSARNPTSACAGAAQQELKIKARSPSLRGTTEATGTKTDTNNEHKRNDRRRRCPVPRAQPDTEQNSACGGRGEEEGGSVYYTCFASGDGGGGEPSQRGEGGFGHGPMRRRSSLSRIDLLAVGMVGVLEGDRQWCPVRLNLFLFSFRVACW